MFGADRETFIRQTSPANNFFAFLVSRAQAWLRLGPGPQLRLIQYTSQPGGPQGAGGYLHIIMADKFYPHQSKMGHVAKTI